MSDAQKKKAVRVMKRNLETNDDWIVQNQTMQTLANWAKTDETLKEWLEPHLDTLADDERKSVLAEPRDYAKLSIKNKFW
jgi:hypothetical protein